MWSVAIAGRIAAAEQSALERLLVHPLEILASPEILREIHPAPLVHQVHPALPARQVRPGIPEVLEILRRLPALEKTPL